MPHPESSSAGPRSTFRDSAGILAGGDGSYRVLQRADGGGYSALGMTALTAWTGEAGGPVQGLHFYLRDRDRGKSWILGRPDVDRGDPITTRRAPGVFTIVHRQDGIEAALDTCVLADVPGELRRLTLTNATTATRRLDVTSLAEIVLNDDAAHAAHPVFSKLFLQTEYIAAAGALLVRRRPRARDESHPLLVHALLEAVATEYETDRARFFGRGRPRHRPAALAPDAVLSGSVGNVLDPVVSLRRTVDLGPGETATMTFLLGTGTDATAALALVADCRHDPQAAFDAAREHATERLRRLGLTPAEAAYAEELAAAILVGDRRLRADAEVIAAAAGGPADLARLGIDAGRPLVVIDDDNAGNADHSAPRWWRTLGLPFQILVVGRNVGSGPEQRCLRRDEIAAADLEFLAATAALLVTGAWPEPDAFAPDILPAPSPTATCPASARGPLTASADLAFGNGLGGFDRERREYVIAIRPDEQGNLIVPPRPWANVMANDRLGCIVSETGAGCTWYVNSREQRLTPWRNDPVHDPHDEALYVRDDEDGTLFSCLPGPVPAGGTYEMRHGLGYSRCRRVGDGCEVETLIFVAREDPVRLTRVRVTNRGDRTRRLSLCSYYRLVLGGAPASSGRFVVTALDAESGAMLAQNRASGPFASHVAFTAAVTGAGGATVRRCGDRAAFLGPRCDPADPAALRQVDLPERYGAGLDPCFALQAGNDVAAGETIEITFLLGQDVDHVAARRLVAGLATVDAVAAAWDEARAFWRDGAEAVRVATPSAALDLMVNGWLTYQTLACRMRGRTAFYQSGGAYGFRDQLQDSLSLMPIWPDVTRAQILLHASHQFLEGDVLHWWHPPLSRGIRTRFADDLLWLPFAVVEYMTATGDRSVLAESAPYLTAAPLDPGQDEVFLEPSASGRSADIYDHCCRSLDISLTAGPHGLPLFGAGDWNDGMNRVGRQGRGESVWMGFFLVTIIDGFAPMCDERGDHERASRYRAYRETLIRTLNDVGWDGSWYRRGYYDDGAPLGSRHSDECRIDALAQAWAVLSGVAPPDRAAQALDAVEDHLIDDEARLIRLLTPPFVDTPRDPGYIKGYVAGVRENGGQYTHAALWVVRAFAALGRRQRAAALLDLLNPVLHAATPEQVARYQVEPYVVAADVYGAEPHVGRGGWTWYTGSSGWMLRTALESVLGLRTEGNILVVAPCVPDEWPGYTISWRVPGAGSTRYEIRVDNPRGCSEAVVAVSVDGAAVAPVGGMARLPLVRDEAEHQVLVSLGRRSEEPR